MDNTILNIALDDFGLDAKMYENMSKDDVKILTNELILNNLNKNCLEFSQQILLDCKKKAVSFSQNIPLVSDSSVYARVIKHEKKQKKQNKKMEFSGYENPMIEYITTQIRPRDKSKSKSKSKSY